MMVFYAALMMFYDVTLTSIGVGFAALNFLALRKPGAHLSGEVKVNDEFAQSIGVDVRHVFALCFGLGAVLTSFGAIVVGIGSAERDGQPLCPGNTVVAAQPTVGIAVPPGADHPLCEEQTGRRGVGDVVERDAVGVVRDGEQVTVPASGLTLPSRLIVLSCQ